MKLFDLKKQKTVSWTEKTAPKERLILANITVELQAQDVANQYSGIQRIMLESSNSSLISKTDAEKEAIKAELAEQLNSVYDRICSVIDADANYFTDGFWSDLAVEKAKELQA